MGRPYFPPTLFTYHHNNQFGICLNLVTSAILSKFAYGPFVSYLQVPNSLQTATMIPKRNAYCLNTFVSVLHPLEILMLLQPCLRPISNMFSSTSQSLHHLIYNYNISVLSNTNITDEFSTSTFTRHLVSFHTRHL